MINIIVAVDEAMGIGRHNIIPWDLVEDRKFFRKTTLGHSVIMGRRTFESLGSKPLYKRYNIVVSKTLQDGPISMDLGILSDFNKVKRLAIGYLAVNKPNRDLFVIGGTQIYREFLLRDLVDRVIITHVNGTHSCDTFFPLSHEDLVDKWVWNRTLLMTKDFVTVEYMKGK